MISAWSLLYADALSIEADSYDTGGWLQCQRKEITMKCWASAETRTKHRLKRLIENLQRNITRIPTRAMQMRNRNLKKLQRLIQS